MFGTPIFNPLKAFANSGALILFMVALLLAVASGVMLWKRVKARYFVTAGIASMITSGATYYLVVLGNANPTYYTVAPGMGLTAGAEIDYVGIARPDGLAYLWVGVLMVASLVLMGWGLKQHRVFTAVGLFISYIALIAVLFQLMWFSQRYNLYDLGTSRATSDMLQTMNDLTVVLTGGYILAAFGFWMLKKYKSQAQLEMMQKPKFHEQNGGMDNTAQINLTEVADQAESYPQQLRTNQVSHSAKQAFSDNPHPQQRKQERVEAPRTDGI